VGGKCPLHPNKEPERLKEKNYFFKLTAYRDQLLALYERDDAFVMPESRRHEIRNYVRDHLTDISISREAKALGIGIPVPGDENQKIYVWFDALINYLTAAGYATDDEKFKKYWPADLHLVGKDIIKFHCALWPAMLLSAAKSDELLRDGNNKALLPKQVFAHGYFTIEGLKVSKSLGNAIDPRELAEAFPFDAVRYYLLREITFGEDGDFSRERLAERYNTDLANTLGNLVQRTVAMSRKYFDAGVPVADATKAAKSHTENWGGAEGLQELAVKVNEAYEHHRADKALGLIWEHLDSANKYVEETQPFKLVKEDSEAVGEILYALLESCRFYAWLIHPVLPHASKKIFENLGLDPETELVRHWNEALQWGGLRSGSSLPEPKPIFPKKEAQVQ
jgi:methionyl-tRNA synthetase